MMEQLDNLVHYLKRKEIIWRNMKCNGREEVDKTIGVKKILPDSVVSIILLTFESYNIYMCVLCHQSK